MIRVDPTPDLGQLYDTDETAWLEQVAAFAAGGEIAAMDWEHLSKYLSDRAKRDKREAIHRLTVLLIHLLKWQHQPEKRTRSWELTIQEQREELQELLESATLRSHAERELSKAYRKAVRRPAVETGLAKEVFAVECPQTLEQLLGESTD